MATTPEKLCAMEHGHVDHNDMDNGNVRGLLGFHYYVGDHRSTFPPIAPPML
jgi:hypothetical protein